MTPKYLTLTIICFLISICGLSQKSSVRKYNNVDTLQQYDNGAIVIYKGRDGKARRDTVYHPIVVDIKVAHLVEIFGGEEIKRKKR